MISESLEKTTDEQQRCRQLDLFIILVHRGQQFLDQPIVNRIDLIIPAGDITGLGAILSSKRINRIMNHADTELSHPVDVGK